MKDKTDHTLGDRLRVWRRSLGMTQADLAQRMDVDITTLRKYELGMSTPNGGALTQACQMGLNLNWLLLGEGTMHRKEVLNAFPEDLQSYVLTLSNALLALSLLDESKFALLAKGFAARSEEALRLAHLEQKEIQAEEAAKARTEHNSPILKS